MSSVDPSARGRLRVRLAARLVWCAVAILAALAVPSPAQESPAARGGGSDVQVLCVPVDGEIGVRTVYMVQSALREAHSRGIPRVLLEIDTEGGAVVATKEIEGLLDTLAREEIKVIAFVRRHAWSAGAYIALSCDAIYMAPGASMGAVTPVQMGPGGVQQIPDDDVRRKMISALRSDMRALVERNAAIPPRMAKAAEAMVDPDMRIFEVTYQNQAGVEITTVVDLEDLRQLESEGAKIVHRDEFDTRPLTLSAVEAQRLGFSSGTYGSVEELIRDEFGTSMDRVLRREETWSEGAVAWLDGMKPILFLLGFVLLMLEVKTPGFALPGVLGVLLLGLAMFGSYLVGLAEWTEILLFFLGIGLVAVELFVLPGFLIFGLAGLACVISGLVLSQQSFFLPANAAQHDILRTNLEHILLLTGLAIGGAVALWRATPYIPLFNRILQSPPSVSYTGASTQFAKDRALEQAGLSALVGRTGVAATDLRPVGRMELDGRPVDVLAEGAFVPRGTRLRIVQVRGNQIVVEAEGGDSGEIALGLLVLLWILGLCFAIAEIFFPSLGILSVLSALAFVSAIFLAYTHHGMATGHAFLVLAAIAVPLCLYYSLKVLPRTGIGRRLLLFGPDHDAVRNAAEAPGIHDYLHKTGVALSRLRPSGMARIDGERVDVITQGEMLEKGAPVKVVEVIGNRVVVSLDKAHVPEDLPRPE